MKILKRKVGRPRKLLIEKKIEEYLQEPKVKKVTCLDLQIRKIDHIAYIIYATLIAIIIETIVIGQITK
jgi:hypothetical protein